MSQSYRSFIIWRIPSLRFLDYQRVKDNERKEAAALFGTAEEPTSLASKILNIKSRTFDVGVADAASTSAPKDKILRVKLTAQERKRVEKMIREAKSLQEISQLERALNEGRIPGGALGDEMEM